MEYKESKRRNLIFDDIDVDNLRKIQNEIKRIVDAASVEDLDYIKYYGRYQPTVLNANAFINQIEQVYSHLQGILDMFPKSKIK